MARYWAEVLWKANSDTLESLGYGHLRRLPISFVIFVVALVVVRVISGEAQMGDEWKWGLSIIAGVVAVYVPLFVYNFVRAPDRIDNKRRQEISEIRGKLDDRERKRATIDGLGSEMENGLKILNRVVGSNDDFNVWKADNSDWEMRVFLTIDGNFSRAQAITFRSVGSVLAADMPPSFNGEHNTLKLHLNKRIENLRDFLNTQSNKL